MTAATLNLLLFIMLPYLALALFFLVSIQRYRRAPFTYSSLSSQFLENRQHFWGMVSFHYGILFVLTGHLVGLLIPRQVILWNSRPLRLYVLELSALIFALLALVGMCAAVHRRLVLTKTRMVTSLADWIILALLLLQIAAGIYVAVVYPWGSSWYAASAAPYLWSIFTFRPDASFLATMPFAVKLHIVNAWLMVAVLPFTRLVHLLVAPLPYLWRKPEVVRWYGIRRRKPRVAAAPGLPQELARPAKAGRG
jgi:nitrate reductase gamma subunit